MKRLRITVNGISYEVEVEVLEEDEETNFPAKPVHHPVMPNLPPSSEAGAAKPAAPQSTPPPGAGAHTLTSPIAGIVVEVRVSPGSMVNENDPLLVIEAMKMNTNVSSPVAGQIKMVHVKPGESVTQGQVLLEFE